MADRICKWCGREYDGRRSATGGWAVCSEACRQSLAASIDSGTTDKNDSTSPIGWLVRLFVLVLIVGFIRNGCSTQADKSAAESTSVVEQTAASRESTSDEPVPERAAEIIYDETPGAGATDETPTEAASAPTGLSESETPTAPEPTSVQDTAVIK